MSDRRRDGSKLSFSERDKLRRERDSGPRSAGPRGSEAYAQKSYRAALERAFDAGRLAEFAATLQRGRDPMSAAPARGQEPPARETRESAGPPAGDEVTPAAKEGGEAPARPARAAAARRPTDERRKLIRTITEAAAPEDVTHAIDRYMERFGELPRDVDVLERALVHPRTQVVLHALECLERWITREKPRRTRSVAVQLSILEETHADADVRTRAAQVRAAL